MDISATPNRVASPIRGAMTLTPGSVVLRSEGTSTFTVHVALPVEDDSAGTNTRTLALSVTG